jgi:hypothetical protein
MIVTVYCSCIEPRLHATMPTSASSSCFAMLREQPNVETCRWPLHLQCISLSLITNLFILRRHNRHQYRSIQLLLLRLSRRSPALVVMPPIGYKIANDHCLSSPGIVHTQNAGFSNACVGTQRGKKNSRVLCSRGDDSQLNQRYRNRNHSGLLLLVCLSLAIASLQNASVGRTQELL